MTFAQLVGNSTSGIIGLINIVVVPLIFTFAFAAFVWGVVKYFFLHGESDTERANGKQFIFWGVIGMVVLFSVWGFVGILLSTLGIYPGA